MSNLKLGSTPFAFRVALIDVTNIEQVVLKIYSKTLIPIDMIASELQQICKLHIHDDKIHVPPHLKSGQLA